MRNIRNRMSDMIRQSVAAFLLMAGITGTSHVFADEIKPASTETAIAAARAAQLAPLNEAEKTIADFVSSNNGLAWVEDIKNLQRAVNEVCNATSGGQKLVIDGSYGPKTNAATADCLAQKPSLATRIGTRLVEHMHGIKGGVKTFAEKLAQSPASMNNFLIQLGMDVGQNKNPDLRVVLGQETLHAAQMNPGEVDGLWGEKTTKAFAEWKNNPKVVAALKSYPMTAQATMPNLGHADTTISVAPESTATPAPESTATPSGAPTASAPIMNGIRTIRESFPPNDLTESERPEGSVSGDMSSLKLTAQNFQKMAEMLSSSRIDKNFYAKLRDTLSPLVPDAKLYRVDASPTNVQRDALRAQLIHVIEENPELVTSIGQGLYRDLVKKPLLMTQLGLAISRNPDVMQKLRVSSAQKGATLAQRGLLFAAISNDSKGGPAVITALRTAEKAGKTLSLEAGLAVFDKAISPQSVQPSPTRSTTRTPELRPHVEINSLSVLSANSYNPGLVNGLSALVGNTTGAKSIDDPVLLNELQAYLTANPAAFGYVGTGITQKLKATGRYSQVVNSLSDMIKVKPDLVLDIGAGLAVTKQSAGILTDALSAIQNHPVQEPAVNNADAFEILYAQTVKSLFPNQIDLNTALSERTNAVGSAGNKNIRAIEAFMGVSKANGVLNAHEKAGLINYLRSNPSALMTMNYATTQTLIDQKMIPHAVSILADHLKKQPDKIEYYGAAMIAAQRDGADSYFFEAALSKLQDRSPPPRLEASKGSVLRMSAVLAAQQLVLFKTYGQAGPHYEKNPDGTISRNEIGFLLANFTAPKAAPQHRNKVGNATARGKQQHTIDAQTATTALTETMATNLANALRNDGIAIVGEKPTSRALANGIVAYFEKNPLMFKAISQVPTAASNILGFIHNSAGLNEQIAFASQPSFKEMVTANFVSYGESIAQSIRTSTNGTFTIAPLPAQLAVGLAIATTTSAKKGKVGTGLSKSFIDSAAHVLPTMAAGLPGHGAEVVDNAVNVLRDALGAKPAAAPSTISDLQKKFPAAPPELVAQVSNICTQYGVNPAYVLTLMRIETGNTFNPNVKNQQPGQSAFGLAQYTELTFLQSYARYEKNLPPEKQGIVNREVLLALRSDPEVVTHLVCSETKSNGIADGARAYLAGHFLGSLSIVTAIYNQAQLERNAPVIDPSSITTGGQLFQMRQRVLAETGLIPPNFVAANPNTFDVSATTFVDVYNRVFANGGASQTFSKVTDSKGEPSHRVLPLSRDAAILLGARAQPFLARISPPTPGRVSIPPAPTVASVAGTANQLGQRKQASTIVGYSLLDDKGNAHTTLVASWERLTTVTNPVVVIYRTPTQVVKSSVIDAQPGGAGYTKTRVVRPQSPFQG